MFRLVFVLSERCDSPVWHSVEHHCGALMYSPLKCMCFTSGGLMRGGKIEDIVERKQKKKEFS